MRSSWTWLLLLASCSFIDDFDRFHLAPSADAGAPLDAASDVDRDAAADGSARDDAGGAPRDGEAGVRDADVGAGDARVDPSDASRPADASASTGCGATGTDDYLSCYPDSDGDRFPDLSAPPTLACRCDGRSLAVADPRATVADCWDDLASGGADVFPGQTQFFDRGFGPAEDRYDYDCDGAATPERGVYANDCRGLLGLACADRAGFGAATGCGVRASYVSCIPDLRLACYLKYD